MTLKALPSSARFPIAIGTLSTLLLSRNQEEEKEESASDNRKQTRRHEQQFHLGNSSSSLNNNTVIATSSYRANNAIIGGVTNANNNNKNNDGNPKNVYPLPPPPETWPQRPLWVRATPGSTTRILGIRGGSSSRNGSATRQTILGQGGGIPVNNGKEAPNESTVIDFETDHFQGTMLLLLRGAPPRPPPLAQPPQLTKDKNDNLENLNESEDHFDQKQDRTFHAVIRGRFKQPCPLELCICGQTFRRPAGVHPPHWLMHGVVHPLINKLAPHNDIDLECNRPYYWAPLASMAQTITVVEEENGDNNRTAAGRCLPTVRDMELELQKGEPHGSDPQSLMYDLIPSLQQQEQPQTMKLIKRLSATEAVPAAVPSNILKRLTGSDGAASKLIRRLTGTDTAMPPITADSDANVKARKAILNRHFNTVKKEKTEAIITSANNNNGNQPLSSRKTSNYDWSPDKEYTFGLFNYWTVFNDPSRANDIFLDLRLPFLHHISLPSCTDGQPVVLMSAILSSNDNKDDTNDHELGYLWSFEVWHESLYPAAKKHHEAEQEQRLLLTEGAVAAAASQ